MELWVDSVFWNYDILFPCSQKAQSVVWSRNRRHLQVLRTEEHPEVERREMVTSRIEKNLLSKSRKP